MRLRFWKNIYLNLEQSYLFNKYILPQFDEVSKCKINVIQGDAKEKFIDKEFMRNFDSCFIDIWRGIEDGIELYSYFKENEKMHKVKPLYWIEDEFILRYQDSMLFYVASKLTENMDEFPDLPISEGYIDFLLKKIDNYFIKKKYILKDRTSLYNLIFDRKIMDDIFKMKML